MEESLETALWFVNGSVIIDRVGSDLELILQRCCASGEAWSRNHTSCTGPGDVAGIPPQDRLTCLTTLYICCIRTHRQVHCESGKDAARTQRPCTTLPDHGAETFKDCCDGCTLGLRAESMQMPCSFTRFSFGSPWDEAFRDCCQNPYSTLGTSPQLGNGKCTTDNPCDQKCEEIGQKVHCSCYPGYKLSANLKTCEDIDECLLEAHNCDSATEICINSIGGFQCLEKPTVQRPDVPAVTCPVGYEFNRDKRTCDDVDECLLGACPRRLNCINTKGSFRCIPGNSTDGDLQIQPCPRGFQLHSVSGRCIDVDECSEETDTCNRNLQICQNSHGSYQCLDKPNRNRNCPAGFKWNENKDNCEDVDECIEQLDDCQDPQLECRNTVGGYGCIPRCPSNMVFETERGTCLNRPAETSSNYMEFKRMRVVSVPKGHGHELEPTAIEDPPEIGSSVGRNQTTVMRICDRWMQEGTTDRRGRSHPSQCTTSREDRQIVRMAVTNRSVTSRTVAQPIESVTHRSVSARTIRRRLQQIGLSARRPFLGLFLTQNHRRLHHQWCDERRMWVAEWNEVVFTDESRICLQHHDGWIRVWRHRGERMLNSCVMHRHTGPAPGIMVWGGIGYHFRTPLVRIAGTLNSQRYISEVLEPVVLPYHQGLATAIFQRDNAQPHAARIVQRFFVNHQIELLPWLARSPDLSPIENMWSMVAQRLSQITPQLPYRINFGNVWKLLSLLYTKNTSEVSLNQCRGCGSGDLQHWRLLWLLILAGTALYRSL
ncbi:fibulin-1 [Trichonephila clavipes]|nr:fibulin-1 [Trichonephila clavipes]